MTAAIVAEDVRREYGDTVALDGVSLTVDEGEVFACIGPNGAGKTTLVRALLGTTDAEGTVEVFGREPTAVERGRLGVLPQDFGPPERLTARELLDYYAGLYDEARDVDAVLADVGLEDAADTWYENLSGGQQRRVCVGTALVNDPDLLVLDEPTTGIDPAGRRSLWRLVEGLADDGTTVFLTTHYMEEAERLADTVGLLADGQVVARGSPAELVADHGGDSRLVVATDAEPRVTSDIGYPAELADGQLTVYDVPPEAIGDVVATLEAAGATYDSLTWTEPDLEDVYLDLTGRAVTASGDVVDRGEMPLADGGRHADGGEQVPDEREAQR